jgi:hypothetical protein
VSNELGPAGSYEVSPQLPQHRASAFQPCRRLADFSVAVKICLSLDDDQEMNQGDVIENNAFQLLMWMDEGLVAAVQDVWLMVGLSRNR